MKTREIIDKIVTGINGLALPTHTTFKYHRPVSLAMPGGAARVPALSVAPGRRKPEVEDTSGGYKVDNHVMVTWYAGQMSSMTTGQVDETLAAATLDQMELVLDLIETWTNGGLSTLSFQNDVTLEHSDIGPIEGGIYVFEINLTVTSWE